MKSLLVFKQKMNKSKMNLFIWKSKSWSMKSEVMITKLRWKNLNQKIYIKSSGFRNKKKKKLERNLEK